MQPETQQAPRRMPLKVAVDTGGLRGYAEISAGRAQYSRGLIGLTCSAAVFIAAANLPNNKVGLKMLTYLISLAGGVYFGLTAYNGSHVLKLESASKEFSDAV